MKHIKLLTFIFTCFAVFQLNAQLIGSIEYEQDSCNSTVFFSVAGNYSPNAQFEWDFGDNQISFQEYPSNTYNFSDTSYNINLLINDGGQTLIIDTTIYVSYNIPQVIYNYNGGSGCSFPQLYNFSGMNTNPNTPIVNWNWIINNQQVGTGQNFDYTFTAPGAYNVELYATTISGCFAEYVDVITIGQGITASSNSVPNTSCAPLCDGEITVSATGSNGPYTFLLIPGNITFTGYQHVFNNLCAGSYQIEIFDQNQCSTILQEYVSDSMNQIIVNTTINNNSSCDSITCDGSLIISAANGVAPYQYSLDGGNTFQTNNVFDSLCAGTFQVLVEDVNACSATASFIIQNINNNITTSSVVNPSTSCTQICDGSIEVSATGTSGPYTFVLNPGNVTFTGYQHSFDHLCEGAYYIEVFDQNQCVSFIQEYVSQDSTNQIIVDAILNSGIACDTFTCDGEAEVIVSGGVAPYQYSIDGGNSFQANNTFDNLCVGTYQVLVEDANGCSGFYTFIYEATTVGAQSGFYYATCDSSNQGQSSYISVYPFGGVAPYTYAWSNGDTSATINNLISGETYTVIISDANACTYSESFVVPANDCYTITGNVYVDVNGNCIFDSTDYPVQVFVDLTATAGGPWLWIYDYTDANGHFEITAEAGTYFFDINGNQVNNLTQTCPTPNFSVTLDTNNPTANVDFFLSPPTPVQDLSVSIGHITNVAPSTVPGHNRWSYINFCNDGTIPMSGNVVWNYSDELTYAGPGYTNIIPDLIDTVAHTLTFNFTNLQPGECKYVRINFDVPNSMQIGTVIDDEVVINPIAGDVTPTNNTAYSTELSVGSWDPNDKAVYPNGDITVDDNDHHYHIRFQNEGNANATRVIIRDELDVNLDLRTLRNISASHDYILTIENDNELVFTFNNIQLPPKTVNEAASQGFVAFSLSQNAELPVGTEIENTAAIYFDFNPAVITNTVLNTIVEKTTAISDLEIETAVSIYPNPSNGVYNININNHLKATSIKVYDVLGNVFLVMPNLNTQQIQVNLQNSSNGIYFIEITTDEGTAIQKLIKNNK